MTFNSSVNSVGLPSPDVFNASLKRKHDGSDEGHPPIQRPKIEDLRGRQHTQYDASKPATFAHFNNAKIDNSGSEHPLVGNYQEQLKKPDNAYEKMVSELNKLMI